MNFLIIYMFSLLFLMNDDVFLCRVKFRLLSFWLNIILKFLEAKSKVFLYY